MPILVDRERQREHVMDLAARVIADEGIAALTFRRVAAEAGTSTAIVSTYFTDKQDLLVSTFARVARRTSVRFETAQQEGGDLQACLEAWLPMDQDRATDWRVIIAFWAAAVNNTDLAAIQDGHFSRARVRIERYVLAHRRQAEVTPEISRTAEKVLALTLGIAVQAAFETYAPGRHVPQQELLSTGLVALRAAPRARKPARPAATAQRRVRAS